MQGIKFLIENMHSILLYFVPGSIFLYIFLFISSKNEQREDQFLLKSVIISYIIITIINSICNLFNITLNNWIVVIFAITLAVLSSYFISRYYMSNKFRELLRNRKINKSVHQNIWNEIVDVDLGNAIRLFLPSQNIVYYGTLKKYEEKDNNYYIFINEFVSYYYDHNEVINNFIDKKEYWAAINIKDVARFELYYDKDSDRIKD